MQTESFDMRRDMAAKALAAEGDLAEQRAAAAFERHCVPRNTALTGLAVAIPLSLSLWAAIAVLVWLLLH